MTAINPYRDFGLAGILVPGSNKGKIVYVDTAANGALDTNPGTRVGEAKLTIHGALAICTDYMWDTIVILNYTPASEITWPIAVDKANVHIVGAPGGGYMPRYSGGQVITAVGDFDCMHMDADHIRISQLEFRAGASCAGIKFDTGGVARHGFYRCTFCVGAYGVWASAYGMPGTGLYVKDCFFSGLTDGIRYFSNGAHARFEDNIFESMSGVAINMGGWAATAGEILNNIITMPADIAAKAIYLGGTSTRWIVDGNRANYGQTDMATNPYFDNSVNVNHWLRNWAGSAVIMPATA